MQEIPVDVAPAEILGWIKADKEHDGGFLEYFVGAHKDFALEEEFDRTAFDLDVPEDYDLVTATAELSIEPRVERNYWILQVRVKSEVGPCRQCNEDNYAPDELSPEEFEREFLGACPGCVSVFLGAETAEARRHFDDWLETMRARH